MANYEEFKKKAKDALDSFADASVDAYKSAEGKAKILARKTKLRAGIVNDKAVIRRVSVELGTLYYKKYKDDPKSEFAKQCKEIYEAHCKIAEKELELEELKNPPSKSIFVDDSEPCEPCEPCEPQCESAEPVYNSGSGYRANPGNGTDSNCC